MNDAQAWIETLNRLRAAGTPCAMVVVTGTRGSAPREAGARMVVSGGRLVWGTIGGGNLERLAIEHASELLEGASPVSESVAYPLSEKAGQCCGGEVTLFFETFPWQRRRIAIFGAGHVAQALAGLGGYLAADVQLIDSRSAEEIQPPLDSARKFDVLWIDHPEQEVDSLSRGTFLLIMTHSHAQDLDVLERALRRIDDFPYVGLIGSQRKWLRFRKRLEQRGVDLSAIERVVCPIGTGPTSKDPAAIAVSTAAQLLEVMHQLDSKAAPVDSSAPSPP